MGPLDPVDFTEIAGPNALEARLTQDRHQRLRAALVQEWQSRVDLRWVFVLVFGTFESSRSGRQHPQGQGLPRI